MAFRLISFFLLVTTLAFTAQQGEEITLWPGGAPGSEGVTEQEVFQQPTIQKYRDAKLPGNFTLVHQPSIYVFLPPKEKANGMSAVVAPGGGHNQVVIEKEGWEIADWLNEYGIAAFVLKYRLARPRAYNLQRGDPWPAGKPQYTVVDHALADTARAMRLVRSRAKEFGLDPNLIGVIGFSAGGENAALMATRFDAGNAQAGDAIERVSSRPDWHVNVYPGFRPGLITVPENAPPSFLVCSDDDRSHITTTVNLYLDLFKQKIPSEMHIYASGGHGFALRPFDGPVSTWEERLLEWLVDRKLMKK